MAEAFFNALAKRHRAYSAGTKPALGVNPQAVEVMKEVGIDLSGHEPKLLTREMLEKASRVITMGCAIGGLCPAPVLGADDWNIEDPAGKPIKKFREVRDEILKKAVRLVEEIEGKPI